MYDVYIQNDVVESKEEKKGKKKNTQKMGLIQAACKIVINLVTTKIILSLTLSSPYVTSI